MRQAIHARGARAPCRASAKITNKFAACAPFFISVLCSTCRRSLFLIPDHTRHLIQIRYLFHDFMPCKNGGEIPANRDWPWIGPVLAGTIWEEDRRPACRLVC